MTNLQAVAPLFGVRVEELVEHGAGAHHLPVHNVNEEGKQLRRNKNIFEDQGVRARAQPDSQRKEKKNGTLVESGVHMRRSHPKTYMTASKQSPPEDVRINWRSDSVASLRASSGLDTPGTPSRMVPCRKSSMCCEFYSAASWNSESCASRTGSAHP